MLRKSYKNKVKKYHMFLHEYNEVRRKKITIIQYIHAVIGLLEGIKQ